MTVAILGEEGSGKATFLTLLYTAQVKYSADSKGDFRFYTERKYLGVMADAMSGMMMGNWPGDELLTQDIRFTFGYGQRPTLMNKLFKSERTYKNLTFELFDTSSKPYDRLKTQDVRSGDIREEVRDILRQRIWVILLNPIKKKDTALEMANLLYNLAVNSSDPIHPLFVFTKFDKIDKKALGISSTIPQKPEERKALAQTVMKRYYKDLFKNLGSIQKFVEPAFFFVHVNTKKEGEKLTPQLKENSFGMPELDYAYDEYVKLIQHLGKLAEGLGMDEKAKQS